MKKKNESEWLQRVTAERSGGSGSCSRNEGNKLLCIALRCSVQRVCHATVFTSMDVLACVNREMIDETLGKNTLKWKELNLNVFHIKGKMREREKEGGKRHTEQCSSSWELDIRRSDMHKYLFRLEYRINVICLSHFAPVRTVHLRFVQERIQWIAFGRVRFMSCSYILCNLN